MLEDVERLAGDPERERGAGDRQRQDGEHRDRVQERVELRGRASCTPRRCRGRARTAGSTSTRGRRRWRRRARRGSRPGSSFAELLDRGERLVLRVRRARRWRRRVIARSRSRRVIACSAGRSSVRDQRRERHELARAACAPCSRARSSGRERWSASRRRRTSMRRPPALYLPTRTPPTSALSVVATSSIETPRSAARARSGSDAQLRHAELVVGVEVDHQCRSSRARAISVSAGRRPAAPSPRRAPRTRPGSRAAR